MFIREYICEKCGTVQERWLKDSKEENTEKCEHCAAEPESLKPSMPSIGRHGSWGRWSV